MPIAQRPWKSALAWAPVALLGLAGFLGFAACSPEIALPLSVAETPAPVHLKLDGSSTMAPLLLDIAQRFQADHPGVSIDVQGDGSGKGVSGALEGLIDIGMVARVLKGGEQKLKCFAVARDGLCFVVHSSNTLDTLSAAQAADIYTGRVTDWKDLRGAAGPIYVVGRTDGRGAIDVMSKALGLRPEEMHSRVKAGSNAEVVRAVSAESASIAYMSIAAAEGAVLAGAPLKLLAFDDVEPSTATLRSGDFPIARPLILVTRDEPRGMQREFIDYCLSPAVVDLIRLHSFVTYQD